MTPLTSGDVLMFLLILVSLLGLVVLYNLLFIVVDVRRVMKRVQNLMTKVEDTILKPIAIMDHVLTAVMDLFEAKKKKNAKHGFDQRNIK